MQRANSGNVYSVEGELEKCKELLIKAKTLINKYGNEIGSKLINHEYWVGMTKEQLLDCKGEPTKVETQALKTKTKHIYIYGNKSSGDYFCD